MGQGRRSVLVVEDDPDIREAIAILLADVGFVAVPAADGRAALALLRDGLRPDAILLDLVMPVMDGWEFRAQQKHDPALAEIPTIVMSANPTAQAQSIDAFRIITKPFDADRLMQVVREAGAASEEGARERRRAEAEKIAALGTLAGGIAHEINNPLAFITTNLRLIEREVDRMTSLSSAELAEAALELRAMLRDSLDGAERIASIVRGIRAFSGRAGTLRPVDVSVALELAARLAGGDLKARARLVRDISPTPSVLADEGTLAQAFLHVLVNAAQAIPEGAADQHEVKLVARPGAGVAIVEISDTGAGIPANVLPHVFEPFFTTKPVGSGTGLGLSIAHGIVRTLGGTIDVFSEVGKGTMVRVTVPAASAEAKHAAPRSRVLVVDDEPAVGRSVARLLGERFDVTACPNAAEALGKLRAERFDAILCNLLMPEMNGMDLFETVSTERPGLEDKMVFMTGGAVTPRARAFVAARPSRCIEKPFQAADLEAVLGSVLGQASS